MRRLATIRQRVIDASCRRWFDADLDGPSDHRLHARGRGPNEATSRAGFMRDTDVNCGRFITPRILGCRRRFDSCGTRIYESRGRTASKMIPLMGPGGAGKSTIGALVAGVSACRSSISIGTSLAGPEISAITSVGTVTMRTRERTLRRTATPGRADQARRLQRRLLE
jgi:hypothetical protein